MTQQLNSAFSPSRATGTVQDQVLDVIVARTLYQREQLPLEAHLEGELGIDSVVLESIAVALRTRFGLDERTLRSDLVTVQDLVDAVVDSSDAASAPAPTAAPAPAPSPVRSADAAAHGPSDQRSQIREAVIAATMLHTHYQRQDLDPDADLESELGVDSVVLASITAEVRQRLPFVGEAPSALGATTLRELCERFDPDAPPTAPPTVPKRRPVPAPVRIVQGTSQIRRPAVDEAVPWDTRSMKDFAEERDPDLFAKVRSFGSYHRSREAEQLHWYGMPLQSRCENRAVIHDELTGRTREFLMFASNNYLGLANHPKVVDAVCDATRVYGATNTGCRLIGGTNVLHKELERRLAAFKQRPAAIVFPGGYSANIGVISALVKSYDAAVVDKLNHMSIVDGCRLSGGQRRIYRHNDMDDLERVLKRCADQAQGRLIVTDGVFSMHGDVCDLPGIVRLAEQYGARVLVDDAHATGVLGATGSGTAEHFGLKGRVDLELGTMSKTLAGMGGFIVGDEDVIEYLRFYANSYVFAATIPAGVAAGLIAAIDVIEKEPERLARLWSNIRTLRRNLVEAGFDLENSDSAILPVVIGDERKTMEMGRAVRARGLFCQTVVYPGVPVGDARLRISVTSEHTPEDLDEAANIFIDAGRETGVLPSRGDAHRPIVTDRSAATDPSDRWATGVGQARW
ncbi:aminotransferase class I/II-fold pyridoxal phosphate-dependent enzyme [Catenulispora rubra]|uniref:aminotransferase class I/II-fold pyridoxal phosphate-dependent enzyme n=1 Tax=Catenulispora rubra TaxID=280293 RepID=UPI0018925C1D|nr:aminotransferase class I/II-fold pyridoxal phosphate-dependent enzyme [Catenulispora rubra]